MKRAIFYFLTCLLIVTTSYFPAGLASAAQAPSAELSSPAGDEGAPVVSKLPPIAIGAARPVGKHLVRPRQEVVERWLRGQGKITSEMTPQQVRSAVKSYYHDFAKKSSAWISPEAQERALQRGSDSLQKAPAATSVSAGLSSSAAGQTVTAAVQPVTAKIFALAVDFGGEDTFTYSAQTESGCSPKTVTTSGPLQGQIPHPGPRDNNSVWYDPARTADAKYYESLFFGYQGVGRVRLDLKDPTDHKHGINLHGYTVQDYYDHMSGAGNVVLSGTVEGWVTVDHSEGYYGAPSCASGAHDGGAKMGKVSVSVAQLVVDALQKFMQAHPDYYNDPSPNAFWKQFDANHDGVVDSFWILHAGMGQEEDGGQQGDFAIWSHSWDLRKLPQWPHGFKVYEGDNTTIVVGPYTMQPEDANLGVVVEECGHNLFLLPDLYTDDIQNSVGFWSIMSAGTWAGWLGGATPVGMPLWFRMIAQCGGQFCNWDQPTLSLPFNASSRSVRIGQLESTPEGLYKGIEIDLPDLVGKGLVNRAGTGKGAYTGSGLDNDNITLDREISVSSNAKRLTFQAVWDIEKDRDYGYVMVMDGGVWTILDDLDGVMRETNPNGNNLGHGLTGSGNRQLRFDFSPYRGKTVTLRLRYVTDASKTGAGWWVDDLKLDGQAISQFEDATPPSTFPGWTNSSPGWRVVPSTQSYPNYYLVEWRTNTKYDTMLKTAYVTNYADQDEWQVERVPYNIPGVLLSYFNGQYGTTYGLGGNKLYAAPSIGPKYPLLVVDMNYEPMRLGDNGTVLDARQGSYDAALTLQATTPFTISQIDTGSNILVGSWDFPSQPAVKLFDDSNGYYAGLYAGSPCPDGSFCFANEGGSAVIPAFRNYTTRITHYDGTPYPELYGTTYQGSHLGTGNPGDSGAQWGVRIQLLGKSWDNKTATIRINPPVTP